MIHILCYRCGSHIADTDVARLDWPLRGEMFDVKAPGWFLRPGQFNLDIFCPVCSQFPFHYDTSVPGAVGKALNIKGKDGKPTVMTVKQILMGGYYPMVQDVMSPSRVRSAVVDPTAPVKEPAPTSMPEWPCLECGAKKRFHRAGCSKKAVGPAPESDLSSGVIETKPTVICPGCDHQVTDRHKGHKAGCPVNKGFMPLVPDKEVQDHGESVFKSVKKCADTGEGPPTQEEITQMERDRDARGTPDPIKEDGKAVHLEGKEPRYLRPGELYGPPPTQEEITQMERDRDARGTPDPIKEDGKAVHLEGKEPRYLRPGELYGPPPTQEEITQMERDRELYGPKGA